MAISVKRTIIALMILESTASAVAVATTSDASAKEPAKSVVTPQDVVVECVTDATGGSGRRHGCDTAWSVVRAPQGYFIKTSSHTLRAEGNGSEHDCFFNFGDPVEILPGLGVTQPTSFSARAHARSPKGHFSGRGWSKCYHHLEFAALPSQPIARKARKKVAKPKHGSHSRHRR